MPRQQRTVIAPPPQKPIQHGEDGRPIVPPPIVPDVITRLAPDRNTTSDTGSLTIIDTMPDTRYPIASWLYSISHSIESSAYATHPVASPASLMAYTLIQYTGMMFYIDAFLRLPPSEYATAVLNDTNARLIFDDLIDFVVPSFAMYEFEAMMPHSDDLADNLHYFGSFASSDLGLDYGRLIPSSLFIALHNLLAELPTNTNYPTLAATFYTRTIATMSLNGNNHSITPSHLTAAIYKDAELVNHRYHNWFNRAIDTLLTTNALRIVNASATVTRLHIEQPARYNTANSPYNPYLFMISYTLDNRYAILEMTRNMNDFVKKIFPNSQPLRAYTQFGKNEIPRHLSFSSVLPTWHTLATANAPPTDITKDLFSARIPAATHPEFATAISFLVARPVPADTTTPPSVPAIQGLQPPAPHDNDVTTQLVSSSTTDPTPHSTAVRLFNETRDVAARMMIFDPSSSSKSHLASVVTAGKVIETNDISIVGIPTPDPNHSLGQQNSQYILGAIALKYLNSADSSTKKIVRRRNWSERCRAAQVFMQGFPHQNILPYFRPGLVTPISTVTPPGNQLGPFLPGATFLGQTQHAADGINIFATSLGTDFRNVPNQHFNMWSSYRFYDAMTRQWYILPTLRHIYGTRARLFSSEHISLRLH